MNKKLKILFLCTGNACRSQMAEGWAKKLKSDCIEAFSAGIAPAGLSPRTIKVMAEAGADISQQFSKHIDYFADIDFDYIITLCDFAKENCPVLYGKGKLIHKPFADPTFLLGDEDVIMKAFRKVRDEIRDYILTLPDSLEKNKEVTKK